MVTLPPMPPDKWNAWRVASIRRYASDMIRVGSWPAEDAEARAASLFARLVPDGQSTAGHEFRSVVNEAGETVGAMWFAPDAEIGRGAAFLQAVGYSETSVSMMKRLA